MRCVPAAMGKLRAMAMGVILLLATSALAGRSWFRSLAPEQRKAVRQVCRLRASPCYGLIVDAGTTEREAQLLSAILEEDHRRLAAYCRNTAPRRGTCNTPLVVSFDARPVTFTPAGEARFAFRPGAPVATDWPTAATPWLALDRDGDGAIASGAELFGGATVLPYGRVAHNGFDALAALDASGDGVIDARDPAFAGLLLWADHDGDRASAPAELRRAADVLTAIALASRRAPRCTARGACEASAAS